MVSGPSQAAAAWRPGCGPGTKVPTLYGLAGPATSRGRQPRSKSSSTTTCAPTGCTRPSVGDQVDRYYYGFANRVLWPVFHYSIDRVPIDAAGWDAYRDVNEAFADVVAEQYRTDDTIWIHDYQLMLLPGMLRERLPDARIGFFLHIPFPSSEVFRILLCGAEILNGLLGADLVGVHTFAYMRHFMTSLLHIDGVEADIDRVRIGGREVRIGVFPMGVDAASFSDLASDPDVRTRVDAIGARLGAGASCSASIASTTPRVFRVGSRRLNADA